MAAVTQADRGFNACRSRGVAAIELLPSLWMLKDYLEIRDVRMAGSADLPPGWSKRVGVGEISVCD